MYNNLPSEVDTKELIKLSLERGKIVALPRVCGEQLRFYKINFFNTKLEKSKFGIEEPIEDELNYIDKSKIDLIIVPGVCFDKKYNRLGFGKGYYDKFLINFMLDTIGICFNEQIVDEIPVRKNDIKVKKIISN